MSIPDMPPGNPERGGIAPTGKEYEHDRPSYAAERPARRRSEAPDHGGAEDFARTQVDAAELLAARRLLQRGAGRHDHHRALARAAPAFCLLGTQHGPAETESGAACGGPRHGSAIRPDIQTGIRRRISHQRLRVRNDALNDRLRSAATHISNN